MTVFDFAMQMEADGKAYYEKLASETDLPGLKTIFSRLAEDEQVHFNIFRRLKEGIVDALVEESRSLESIKNIFETLPRPEKAIKNIAGTLEGYQHAMKVEAESAKFYKEAAAEEKDPQTKKVLLQIAAEEQQHFTIMENIYHFTNEPNQHLSGAEISNRD